MSQAIIVGDKDILQINVCILGQSCRHLVHDFLGAQALTALLYDKTLYFATIIDVFGPDDAVICVCALSHPSLVAVQNVAT